MDVDAKLSQKKDVQKDVCLNRQSSGLEFQGFLIPFPQNFSPLRNVVELDQYGL